MNWGIFTLMGVVADRADVRRAVSSFIVIRGEEAADEPKTIRRRKIRPSKV